MSDSTSCSRIELCVVAQEGVLVDAAEGRPAVALDIWLDSSGALGIEWPREANPCRRVATNAVDATESLLLLQIGDVFKVKS